MDKPEITTGEMIFAVMKSRELVQVMTNEITEAIRFRLTEFDRLKHIMECAAIPLMADVLRERDALKVRVAIDAETIKLNFETIDKAIAERDALKAEADKLKRKLTYTENALANTTKRAFEQKARAEEVEAELTEARPLIELLRDYAEEALADHLERLGETTEKNRREAGRIRKDIEDARAALAYRAAKEKE